LAPGRRNDRSWHEADIKLRPLFGRYGVESGHHRLVMSISGFDPERTFGREPNVMRREARSLGKLSAGNRVLKELVVHTYPKNIGGEADRLWNTGSGIE
jgi:hypothetical protein